MRPLAHFLLWTLGLAKPETQTTAAERECLVRHAAGRSTIVEIGVWHGVNTARLRDAMAEGGTLWAVDPFFPGRLRVSLQKLVARREVARRGRGRVGRGRVRWVRTTGEAAAPIVSAEAGGPIGFVFMDGDHRYEVVSREWTLWAPRIEVGGCVALHDSRSTPGRDLSGAGSALATQDVVLTDARFELAEVVDSLTVVRRRGR